MSSSHSRIHRKKIPGTGSVHHRRTGHSQRSFTRKVESFLFGYFFRIAGILLVMVAFLYLIFFTGRQQMVLEFLNSLLNTGSAAESGRISYEPHSVPSIFLSFLPGILLTGFAASVFKKYPKTAGLLSFAGILLLFAVHFKQLTYDVLYTGNTYPGIRVACLVTLALFSAGVILSCLLKNNNLNILTILLFYLSLNFTVWGYGWHTVPLFSSMILATAAIFLVSAGTGPFIPNLLGFILAWAYIGIFWFRKLAVNHFSAFIPGFLVFSSILYVLFLVINLSGRYESSSRWGKQAGPLVTYANTLFFTGSVLFVLNGYGYAHLLWIFVALTAAITAGILLLANRIRPVSDRVPWLLSEIFLVSLILPLLFRTHYLFYFLIPWSALLLVFAKYRKDRFAFVVSLGALLLSALLYFRISLIALFPGFSAVLAARIPFIFSTGDVSSSAVFVAGVFLCSLILMMFLQAERFRSAMLPRWFDRAIWIPALKSLLAVTLYLAILKPVLDLTALFTGSVIFDPEAWFIYSCLFLLILLASEGKPRVSGLVPVMVSVILLGILYPVFINPAVILLRDMRSAGQPVHPVAFLFHFLSPVLWMTLMILSYRHFRRSAAATRLTARVYAFFGFAGAIYFLLAEFDHITVFFTGGGVTSDILVSHNRALPYSVVLLAFSFAVWLFAFFMKLTFLRQLSLLAFICGLIKILVLDLTYLDPGSRIIMFLVLGLVLLGASFFYPVLRRKLRSYSTAEKSGKKDEQ